MALVTLDTQAAPSPPSSGAAALYVNSTTKLLSKMDDAGAIQTVPLYRRNFSTAAQGAGFATDTYLTGSSINIPAGHPIVGTWYQLSFDVAKTAAGTATPIIIVRYGTSGAVGDAARLTFTFSAGTAAADVGVVTINALFRVVGASAVLQGRAEFRHGLSATTGLISQVSQALQVTSGAFDSSVASSIIGVSVNGGTSAAWTVAQVQAELTSLPANT